jgi:hypothetical protein
MQPVSAAFALPGAHRYASAVAVDGVDVQCVHRLACTYIVWAHARRGGGEGGGTC